MFILSYCHMKLQDMFCLAVFSKSANVTLCPTPKPLQPIHPIKKLQNENRQSTLQSFRNIVSQEGYLQKANKSIVQTGAFQ